ncbi:hypothetical protein BaRGS_00019471 [Batillaria attramentaria]|uniref:SH3 domain-containing protein n=1 Tax=Batillaria attramentaria TaxID=370345 RepID=A0ABD0KR51_9CAEN
MLCLHVEHQVKVSSPLPFSSSPERESQTTINADDSIQSRLAKLETQNKQQAERLLRVEEENLRLTASMAEQQRRQFRLEAENSRLNVLMKLLQERTPESHQEQGVLLSEEEENLNKAAVVMWVNIRPVCFTDGWTSAREGDSSTCTAVVHVKTGQAVWLESIGEADFWYGSSFSGFLVSSDE